MNRTPLEVICRRSRNFGFLRSVRAIVRSEVSTDPPLEAGSAVWVSHWAFEGTGAPRFPATPQASPDRLLWLSPTELLPEWEFLHRQPLEAYWVMLLPQGRRGRGPVAHLSDPWNQVFGLPPFRFESLGELTYYLRERWPLNRHEVQVGFVRPVADLLRRSKEPG